MKPGRHIGILIVFLLVCHIVEAQHQSTSYSRNIKIQVKGRSIIKDSLTIIPKSLVIINYQGDTIPPGEIILQNSKAFLSDDAFSKYEKDSLVIHYQTLGIDLGKSYYLMDSIALAQSDDVIKTGFEYKLSKKNQNLFGNDNLAYDGSYSRGFSVGNRQSLVLNSNFNLQMSGIIGDDIEIAAALTDANIPIQAEGNTYQLNEFDRVFIRLKKNQHLLTAGDLEIKNPTTYFSRYQKKLKGINYSDQFDFNDKNNLTTSTSYAISKGKFSRNELKTQEGNQGPYKLVGSAGERFLIVLSGTEKVYFDGVPLKRGSEYDYIIDYNLAEIRFTYNRLITKDSRIIVEFEYVDQSYLRSMQTVSLNWKMGRSQTYFNLYNEQDSKTAIGNASLDTTDIELLSQSGDDILEASRNGIRSYQPGENQIDLVLYRKVFDPVSNDSILVHTTQTDSTLYTAYFSDVGENLGSYSIKEATTLNGRIYEFVGEGNGRYEPIIKLVAPERKQLITLGHLYEWDKYTRLHSELSLSNNDQNRFSNIDDQDNTGAAALIHFETSKIWDNQTDSTKQNQFTSSVLYEYTHDQFKPLNPYRSAEFSRDWNLTTVQQSTEEHMVRSEIGFKNKSININYGFGGFFQKDQFSGYKHSPKILLKTAGTQLILSGDFLLSKSRDYSTRFFRPRAEFQQHLSFLGSSILGFNFNQEFNRIFQTDSVNLASNSFYYNNYRLYLNSGAQNKIPFQLYLNFRQDYRPDNKDFQKNFKAIDTGIKGNWNLEKISKLNYSLTFRQLQIDSLYDGQKIKPSNTLLGKVTHSMTLLKQFLVTNTQLDLNSGQEAKAEYIFIELTNRGEGNYIWIDSNEDGIRQKGEFEEAPFSDEANFIKIIQYNNEFIRVNNALFNHNFRINPKNLFTDKTKNKWQNEISKFSMIGSISLQEKTEYQSNGQFPIPFFTEKEDSTLVVLNNTRNISLYYNKLSPVFDIQLNHKANLSRNLQLDGLIEQGRQANSIRFRYSMKKSIDLILNGSFGNREYRAALYPIKDYNFDFTELSSEMKYRLSKKTGLEFNYVYITKNNDAVSAESLKGNRIKARLNLRNWYKMNIQFSVEYAKLNYTGEANTSLELAMLEGLKNGDNFLWQSTLTRKMSNNIDLSFRYEGRKTGEQKTVHIASMQAKARF